MSTTTVFRLLLYVLSVVCIQSLGPYSAFAERARVQLVGELPSPHLQLKSSLNALANNSIRTRKLAKDLTIRIRKNDLTFVCKADRQNLHNEHFTIVGDNGKYEEHTGDLITLSGHAKYKNKKRRIQSGRCALSLLRTGRNSRTVEISLFLNKNMFSIKGRYLRSGKVRKVRVRRNSVKKRLLHQHADGTPCGAHADEHSLSDSSPESNNLSARNGSMRIAETNVVADGLYTQKHGSAQNAIQRLLADLSAASVFYEPMNIRLEAKEIVAYLPGNDPFTSSLDAQTLLYDFRYKQPQGYAADISHLWTGRSLNGSTIGIAFIGTVCIYPWNVGLSEDYGGSAARAVLVAHEIGHNFSSQHDGTGNGCGTGTHIMSPWIVSGAQGFSNCSKNYINNFASSASCLTQHQEPPQTAYTVTGSVKDHSGKPIAQALVTVRVGATEYETYTDLYGRYSLEIIGPGNYSLTIEKNGYVLSSSSGSLVEGLIINTVLEKVRYLLTVKILDLSLLPVSGVSVTTKTGTDTIVISSNANGIASFQIPHAEQYKITLNAQNCYFEHTDQEGQSFGMHQRVAICR